MHWSCRNELCKCIVSRECKHSGNDPAAALVQWLKLPARKVVNRGFEPHSGLQVSKKQNRKDSLLWGASVTERLRARDQTARARISYPVSGGLCHLIHLTILRRFSWLSLSYICTQMAENHNLFISFDPEFTQCHKSSSSTHTPRPDYTWKELISHCTFQPKRCHGCGQIRMVKPSSLYLWEAYTSKWLFIS